jgi:hypothetical protein
MSAPLKDPLKRLQDELDQAAANDPAHPEIATLQHATRQSLAGLEGETDDLATFRTQLDSAVVGFEATHPQLTLAIMQVIDALNRIGI